MNEIELLKAAVPPVLVWFRIHKRDLPWRKCRTPYTALVAELMLQQTRVEAVKVRYVEFLERFPTAEALASASEEEVLKMWEGLGYYSRARNLHNAAKIIAREGFPQTWVGVRALPGVGDYTAGAVCSIALGLPTPAVDGNVLRILTRLFADGRNVDDAAAKKYFSELLAGVYPPETADFTEALMELGATVCVPNGPPMCGACPWSGFCKAHLEGEEEEYPVRSEKRARKVEKLAVYVFRCGNKYALVKRPEGGLLAGLYGFPTHSRSEGDEAVGHEGRLLATKAAKHIFTHVEWHMTGYLMEVSEENPAYNWTTAEEIREKYAVPSAFKAFLAWVC